MSQERSGRQASERERRGRGGSRNRRRWEEQGLLRGPRENPGGGTRSLDSDLWVGGEGESEPENWTPEQQDACVTAKEKKRPRAREREPPCLLRRPPAAGEVRPPTARIASPGCGRGDLGRRPGVGPPEPIVRVERILARARAVRRGACAWKRDSYASSEESFFHIFRFEIRTRG